MLPPAPVAVLPAVPVVLPPVPEVVVGALPRLDALILSGGPDVEPVRYGETPGEHTQPPNQDRDESEVRLLSEAIGDGLYGMRDVDLYLAVARNLGTDLSGLTTVNFDQIQHYRPRVNVVERPT